jgi:UDP-N-acetyl-D-mannosaminuronic acid transferase (WecB/TagA/CpsF family)
MAKFQRILGINFFVGDMPELLGLCKGHFVVVPAAPALTNLPTHAEYREALEKSDFAITDSAFMVILWKFLTGQTLPRISGLRLLRGLLDGEELKRPGASLWIMPSAREQATNLAWLNANGFPVTPEDCFIPPFYGTTGPVADPGLLRWAEARQAPYILIAIGGGVQERVGYYLRENLSYRPSILCVGAAVGFITGAGVRIPAWADHLMLGSIYRTLADPKRFLPRYWKAMQLPGLLFKYRDRSVAES